jgi:putative aldouronate transport system permease protein
MKAEGWNQLATNNDAVNADNMLCVKPKRSGRFNAILKSVNRNKFLFLLLLPGLAFYLVFNYIPMYGVLIAFKDFKMEFGKSFMESVFFSDWVGLKHFIQFINSYNFVRVVRNTFLLSSYNLVFGFPLPILFALALNELKNQTYKRLVQTVSYLPHFISTVAIVGMLTMFLSPDSGFINGMITKVFGIEPIYFLMEPKWFRTIYVASDIWQELGWNAVIYLAALAGVDLQLYEAAEMDGATRLKKIWHITLPALKTTIVLLLILKMGQMFSVGADKIILMYQPNTYETGDVIQSFIYRRGLQYAEYSYTTAVGLFNSAINISLLLMANWISRKLSEESLF